VVGEEVDVRETYEKPESWSMEISDRMPFCQIALRETGAVAVIT